MKQDLDALRNEVRSLRRDNEDLARKVDGLSSRVDALSARAARPPAKEEPVAPIVPPDLAVVRVEPDARSARTPPPVPTALPIAEPDPERLEALAPRGGREIGAQAEDELKRARKRSGAAKAHALEAFVARYPRHPSADNALVEAAAVYAESEQPDAACDLARRVAHDYPAGDAVSDAIERLAWCESRKGAVEAERRLLEQLVNEFPRTPAAQRAETRLATISGHGGDTPSSRPARSGP